MVSPRLALSSKLRHWWGASAPQQRAAPLCEGSHLHHGWEMSDLVAVIEAAEAPAKPRGPYKKRYRVVHLTLADRLQLAIMATYVAYARLVAYNAVLGCGESGTVANYPGDVYITARESPAVNRPFSSDAPYLEYDLSVFALVA